ncbi:RNA polymerase II-associated factor 1-like protein, partial [Armadillidium nasatum]
MPPTVHQSRLVDREKRPRTGTERRSDLVCRVKYCNTLPDIPFDPKFINYPFSSNRYVQYKPTSLEKNYKYEVLTEHDLGVSIDLINPEAYAVIPGAELHPTDEKLLEDDVLLPQSMTLNAHDITMLMYHGFVGQSIFQQKVLAISLKLWKRLKQQLVMQLKGKLRYLMFKIYIFSQHEEENIYTDRESQLEAIEKTFTDVKVPLNMHYSKPGVHVVEELAVYPDFDLWKYPCAQVIFDSDPAPVGRPVPAQLEEMSQAMIRGVMDESGEQFVAYFLPTEDTLEKRRRDKEQNEDYKDEEEYDYTMAREYNWNVKNKASKGYEENYFLVIRDDGVFYNELETRYPSFYIYWSFHE